MQMLTKIRIDRYRWCSLFSICCRLYWKVCKASHIGSTRTLEKIRYYVYNSLQTFQIHLPHPTSRRTTMDFSLTDTQHQSTVGVLSECEDTITFRLVLLLLKHPPITPSSTYLEYLSLQHFQNSCKLSSGLCPGKSLSFPK